MDMAKAVESDIQAIFEGNSFTPADPRNQWEINLNNTAERVKNEFNLAIDRAASEATQVVKSSKRSRKGKNNNRN